MSVLRDNTSSPPAQTPAFLHLRAKSLPRANAIVLASLAVATLISHAPHLRPSLWLVLPFLTMLLGTADTVRCMRRRWSFYHGGVLLCIYMDLMALTLALFFLLYPYFVPFSDTH